MTSDGGVMLLGEVDRKLGLLEAAAHCIADPRNPLLTKHQVRDMLRQRVYGLAQGWEDLNELFVRGLPEEADNLAIVRAVVSMAHSLGLPVLAKDVETGAERDCLQALDCERLQGHLTGRPMPAEAATAWLSSQAQRLGVTPA